MKEELFKLWKEYKASTPYDNISLFDFMEWLGRPPPPPKEPGSKITDRTRYHILKDGVEVECRLENGKANPFGWSQYEIHHEGNMIGWLYCGYVKDLIEGYTFTQDPETP